MSSRDDFKVGDIVQIGSNGEKGKIIDIFRLLGTYCMYKVHSLYSGEIKDAAKHELVKGLPDENFQNLFDCFSAEDVYFDADFDDVYLESLEPEIDCAIQEVPKLSSNCLYSNQDDKSDSTITDSKCFAKVNYTPNEYRQMQKNKNTENKTKSHLRLIGEFPATKNEVRQIHMIPPEYLDPLLQEFVVCVRQKDGSEYEPSTLRGMISSLDRHLAENGYGTSIARGKEFSLTMATFHSKGKDLKKQGKGNKRKAANDIKDEEVEQLYSAKELGNHSPTSLINTLWFNNTLHFGIRGGAMEHRHLAENGYGTSIARGKEFSLTMATFHSKGKDLKKQGKGNKRKAANDIKDEEVEQLYSAKELGNHSPTSLINTLWFNNTLHFGIRGGAMEHRQLKWGDITLGFDSSVKCEYLEFAERQTKTRTGEDSNNLRKQNPRLYATGNERCPIETYKIYANHRPSKFSDDDHQFYLAVVTHKKYPQEDEQWFLSAPIGVNKLKDLMKIMAQNAKLPELMNGKRLTNTSVRKRLCQKLLQNNVPDTQAVLITGHKYPSSLNNYRVLSNQQQKKISDLLSSASCQTSVVECRNYENKISQNVSNSQTSFVAQNVPSFSLFANATITGDTFHITIQNPEKM